MWRFVLAVSLLCCSSDASVTCKDENGGQVDWFILYKAPKQKDKLTGKQLTGLEYIYIGPDAHGKVTNRTGTDIKDVLANTLRPILKSVRKMPEDFGFISYSDQPPGCSADNQKFGHSKGVVMVDKTTAVWLLHSTPQFPFRRDQNKFWPDSGEENAQTFICVKFPSEPANIEHIGKHLQSIGAFPFDHDIPDGFYDELKRAVNWNKLDPPGVLQPLIKKGDVEFYSIAKKQAEKDDDLTVGDVYFAIAEKVESVVYVQTWGRQSGRANCEGDEKVENIESVKIKGLGEWKPGNDHSKWCVAADQPWTCIADVNRAKSQFERRGGALCIKNKDIADTFRGFVSGTENCPGAQKRRRTSQGPQNKRPKSGR